MIFDNQALFSKNQAITATAPSTNAIDLGLNGTIYGTTGAMPKDVGKGNEIPLLVQVTEDFNNLTSLRIDIEIAPTTAFSSPKVISLGTYLLADLKAGFQIPFTDLPNGINNQFIQLRYTVTGTAPSTGKVTAGIVAAVQTDGV